MLQNLKEHETQAGYGHICINRKRILTVILTENAKKWLFLGTLHSKNGCPDIKDRETTERYFCGKLTQKL